MKKLFSILTTIILIASLALPIASADIPDVSKLTATELRTLRDQINAILASAPVVRGTILKETSRSKPARMGEVVECQVDNYVYGKFIYQITLKEVIRGVAALALLKQEKMYFDDQPELKNGEFLIAIYSIKIKKTNDKDPEISFNSFVNTAAVSADGKKYSNPWISYKDNSVSLYAGGSADLYAVYEVAKGESPTAIIETSGSSAWISLAPAPQPK